MAIQRIPAVGVPSTWVPSTWVPAAGNSGARQPLRDGISLAAAKLPRDTRAIMSDAQNTTQDTLQVRVWRGGEDGQFQTWT